MGHELLPCEVAPCRCTQVATHALDRCEQELGAHLFSIILPEHLPPAFGLRSRLTGQHVVTLVFFLADV